ncbi:MAG: hypothetical protein Kow0069_24830 [Promethearchaeota archaeon]
MAYDALFKLVTRKAFAGATVHLNEPVGTLPLQIDAVLTFADDPLDLPEPPPPAFAGRLARTNVLEFKGKRDPSRPADLNKLLGYLRLYASNAKEDLGFVRDQCAAFLVCASRPRFLDDHLARGLLSPAGSAGLYSFQMEPQVAHALVLEEVDAVPGNLLLLLLSTGEALRSAVRVAATAAAGDPELTGIVIRSIILNYSEVKDLTETQKLLREAEDHDLREAVDAVGLERVVDAVGLERVVDAVGLERVVDVVGLERVVDVVGLEDLVEVLESKGKLDELLELLEEKRRRGRGS